jgi:hydroxymethylpyrimidine/phosphomethylpyrimidine kinase
MIPIALTIAGSDCSGGAGIQADLKTFSALGVYGASVITALTAQNTLGVSAIHGVPGAFITAQLDAVFEDLDIGAIKIGMVGSQEAINAVADRLAALRGIPIVLDPVMVATSGDALLERGAELLLRERLIPLADLITPNLHEAARLLGDEKTATDEAQMREQAERLLELGPKAVLVKGGHGEGKEAVDILVTHDGQTRLSAPRIATSNTHGTGCTLSSAIAAGLAKGASLEDACARAKTYLTGALAAADAFKVGQGAGPVHHFFDLWDKEGS